jgi:hypothetical protein
LVVMVCAVVLLVKHLDKQQETFQTSFKYVQTRA